MAEKKEFKRIAVIRIKGKPGLTADIKNTFEKLRLYKKNMCVIISNKPEYAGMIKKIDHAVTWGEIDEKTCVELLKKRGKLPAKKALTEEYMKEKAGMSIEQFSKEFVDFKKEIKDVPGLKSFFRLSPPRHGFERKGVKVPFAQGGVLGYRKEKINELIARMI